MKNGHKIAKKIFEQVKKRDGRIVPFDVTKMVNAIYKATVAVGESNFDLANVLANEAVEKLLAEKPALKVPTVEEIQDAIERALMDSGHSRVAKAYILYRQKRSEIRAEKQQVLDKTEIDDIDKQFDINALRVLRSRYLRKDEAGKVLESPRELFERVALHAVLPSLLYDEKIFQKRGKEKHRLVEFDAVEYENKIKIGRYHLNRFHLEALKNLFDLMAEKKKTEVSWNEFFSLLKGGYFDKYAQEIDSYLNSMVARQFMPNTPAIANFGNFLGMGSGCFVLEVGDSIESIMQTLSEASIIFKSGGGVGYNFSQLRPEGDYVKTTGGVASGPISFMTLFDRMTEVIKQGGIRRGANMGILNSNHPDIEKFITAKKGNLALHNFNISVLLMRDFWEYYEKGKPYPLTNPRTKEIVNYVNPKDLFNLIIYQAWESAEPGVIFEDRLNKYNPFYDSMGPLLSTNPCGEVPLYPYESCNLGSINLYAFIKIKPANGKKKEVTFNWNGFAEAIRIATRFLDNVIDINKYPLAQIREKTWHTRKIGLGIMGLADVLLEMEIPYNSSEGISFMEQVMEFLNFHSKTESVELAKERGSFTAYQQSFYSKGKLPFSASDDKKLWRQNWPALIQKIKRYGLRNSHTTVVAPTGSISMIAGCSSGMEPAFSLIFEKVVPVGRFYYVNPIFEEAMMREGLFDEQLIRDVSESGGGIKNIGYIPSRLKKIFITALDLSAEDHVRALAACQKWVDLSISKTINFSTAATMDDMRKAYFLAYQLGCKDVTVYRDKSLKTQVLIAGGKKDKKEPEEELLALKDEKAKGLSIYHEAGSAENLPPLLEKNTPKAMGSKDMEFCPTCKTKLIEQEGCKTCPACGFGLCI